MDSIVEIKGYGSIALNFFAHGCGKEAMYILSKFAHIMS